MRFKIPNRLTAIIPLLKTSIISCCIMLGTAYSIHAQNTTGAPDSAVTHNTLQKNISSKPMTEDDQFQKIIDSIDKSKIGNKISLEGIIRTVDNKKLDFSHLENNALLYFGFYGCKLCEKELPVFIELATESPNTNFIYITYNGKDGVYEEFSKILGTDFQPSENFYIIRMDKSLIDKKGLTIGYPTEIGINKSGIIKSFDFGGLNTKDDLKDAMNKRLLSLSK